MIKIYPQFEAKLINKQFVFKFPKRFREFVSATFKEGQEILITVRPRKKNRTLKQNAYYWLVLNVIADYTGHSSDELHEIYKHKFLPRRVITYQYDQIELPGTTTVLTTDQFGEYLDRIIAEAGTMGVTVPIPEELA